MQGVEEVAIVDPRTQVILDVVIRALESGGYDAVNLRAVAREARVSLATIYEVFPSRQALCVAAMRRWMDQRFYETLPVPDDSATRADRVLAVLHHLLGPFLEQPVMLTVIARVRLGVDGERLLERSLLQSREMARVVRGPDHAVSETEQQIIYYLLYSLTAHYAVGQIGIDEIVPTLDTCVRRILDGADATESV